MDRETYVTPRWVYDALNRVEDFSGAFDCAPVESDFDFLSVNLDFHRIATNPPFSLGDRFCWHAIERTRACKGRVAMLLPMTFDAAKSRVSLWLEAPFKCKYTLLRRIRWTNLEQKKAGPSANHAWFVWDWQYTGTPTLGYLP